MTEKLSDKTFARPLSPFESYFAVTSATIWATDYMLGPLDLDTLQEAWNRLRQANPVLTAQLANNEDDKAVSVAGGLWIVVPAVPDASPIGRIDGHVLTLGAGGPVAALKVSTGEEPTRVALAFHHAISDGRLVQHWRQELWSCYTELAEGRTPTIRPRPVPQSPEALLGERGIVRTALAPSRLEYAASTNVPSGQSVNPVLWRQVRLGERNTTALLAESKRLGQSVHSLVAGVAAVTTRRFLPIDDIRAVEINVVSPVDIRTRLQPPAPAWAGTNILGMANSVVAVHLDSDPAAIGATVAQQLAEDLASGVIHQSFLHMADTVEKPQPLVPRTITTNLSVLETIPTPQGLKSVELRHALRFAWAPVIAMMKATGLTDHPLLSTSVHMIHTCQGRLTIDFSTYLPQERAEEYAREFETLLVEMTAHST